MLDEEWKALGYPVADECTDGEFLRRASLDVIGRIPTLAETEAYLRDRRPGHRARLIDKLLASEGYGGHFATLWTKLMIPDGMSAGANQNVNPNGLHAWLEKEFNRGAAWDEMVRQLIAARGRWDENGAVNFVIANLTNGNSVQLTSQTTKLFLCVQTQCTECHDHPWNEWKQDQFHGMNAFFVGTKERRQTKTLPSGQIATDYYELSEIPFQQVNDKGSYFERRNGLAVYTPPTYLDGRDVRRLARGSASSNGVSSASFSTDEIDEAPIYLRDELAKAITAPTNPYFARAIVNRLWHHYLGHSFTKDVDDFDNGQDEPSMPDLLNLLAKNLIESGYDLKSLSRWIMNAKAYQRSSRHKGKEAPAEAAGFFTTRLVKPLSPEQLYDSVMTLTRAHEARADRESANARQAFLRSFQQTFGSNEVATSSPTFNGTITQALMMMNSPTIVAACACRPGTFLHELVMDGSRDEEKKIDSIYLAALCRKPNSSERKEIALLFKETGPKNRAWVYEDVLWIVLNSAEFVLNY